MKLNILAETIRINGGDFALGQGDLHELTGRLQMT